MKAKIFRSWRLAVAAGEMILVVVLLKGPLAAVGDDGGTMNAATVPATATSPPTIPDAAVASATLSTGASEVVKLAQAGMSEDVMLAYIAASKSPFKLGSDQIAYLNDVGISGIVVKAMIQRDAAINNAAVMAAANAQPPLADTNAPFPLADYAEGPMPAPLPAGDDSSDAAAADYSDDNYGTDNAAYFYDSLAPYGSWIFVSGLGYCWQPTVYTVDHSWRPYSDRGRWLYTDCGWYWQSDYSWGWAPFHYGRWYRNQEHGWVWMPDRVWGPAWVSWRQSAEYCGWAPLPPSAKFAPGLGFRFGNDFAGPAFEFGLTAKQYTFIPIERMTDGTPSRYSLTTAQSAEAYQETKVVNHYTVQNNRVVSRGVDPQQVAKVSGEPVREAQIQVYPQSNDKRVPVEHLAQRDNKLMIFRPHLPSPDVNYRKNLPPIASTTGATRESVVASANEPSRIPATQPLMLAPPPQSPAALAEHRTSILVVPDRPITASPAPSPVGAGIAGYYGRPDGDHRFDNIHATPLLYDAQTQPAQTPANRDYTPRYYYPQSSILTPPRSQNNSGPAPAPPAYYGNLEPRPAPIHVPPAFSHTESAPAPAPVYHQPPVESHPAPPPQESHSSPPSSSSSSPSSSSGHH